MPRYFAEGVVGFPDVVSSCLDQPIECFECRVTSPDGGDVVCALASSDSFGQKRWSATFLPEAGGTYHLVVGHRDAGQFVSDLDLSPPVFAPASPDLTLNRPCELVTRAAGRVSCDDSLYDESGGQLETLDGGLWLGARDLWLAWQAGAVFTVAFDDGGAKLATAGGAPLPNSISRYASRIAVGGPNGGVLFELDAGQLSALATLGTGQVDVYRTGDVLLLHGSALCANEGGQWVNLPFGGGSRCYAPLPDGGDAADGGCCRCPGLDCLYLDPVPRRGFASLVAGVRVAEDALLFPDAGRLSAGDDFIWQSNATQTAVWLR